MTQFSRRDIIKAAVAAGGMSALAACTSREESPPTTTESSPKFPRGVSDPTSLPARQHAWDEYVVRDARGLTQLPHHQVLLFLNYAPDGTPTESDRDQVERALRTLEKAFQWGTGGNQSAVVNPGLLFTIGYSPSYFDRFDQPFAESDRLMRPEQVLSSVDEDPAKADHYDAVLHLASDYGEILLQAEEALFGNVSTVNGLEMAATFEGVFTKAERRTGFVGPGLPKEKYEMDSIPEDSPLSMGYKSAFEDNIPSEDKITITEGPFAQGTTQQVSNLSMDLDDWYERNDLQERTDLMFSPAHDQEDVGETGKLLGSESGITEEIVDNLPQHAEKRGRVGHSQKTAQARDDDFEPIIKRRDFDATGEPGLHFNSLQLDIEDFVETRQAMSRIGDDDGNPHVDEHHDGILGFIETKHRATFLMPPRSLRSLPDPSPS